MEEVKGASKVDSFDGYIPIKRRWARIDFSPQQLLVTRMGFCMIFTNMTEAHNTLALKNRNIEEYISGFVDGEGCFSVSFTKCPRFAAGWETKPSFSVSQNTDRAQQILVIQKYFGCGFVRDGKTDNTIKYEVRRLDDLLEKVLPHFEKYPLLSAKQRDIDSFKKICVLMKKDEHKTLSGLSGILPIAFNMNASGKRKYSQKDILNFSKLQMKV